MIASQQRVPIRAPDHLDDVPARAPERGLELLDDLAVAADRAVEALEVAVDDEDQVVELFARGERDRAERFGLVGLAVAQKRPHLRPRRGLEAAVLQIAHEARLIDRGDRAEPHRHGRELPEVGHQPRVRVRRQPASGPELVPEVLQLLRREPPLQERPRVDARRGVPLEQHEVTCALGPLGPEEVVEAHLVERGGRRVGRDVAADALRVPVGLDDHGQRVPADQTLDAALDLAAARKGRLVLEADRVDVGRVGRERERHALLAGVVLQGLEQAGRSGRAAALDDVVERIEPLARFLALEVGIGFRSDLSHSRACPRVGGPSGASGARARSWSRASMAGRPWSTVSLYSIGNGVGPHFLTLEREMGSDPISDAATL